MGDKKNLKLLYTVKDIPIENLLHSDQFAYEKEGHGGKPVFEWPIYFFFRLYYLGKKAEAFNKYKNWYLEQYLKYRSVEGKAGGMKYGSLDRLYKSISDNKKGYDMLNEAISIRVQQRFNLLDNILIKGYVPDYKEPVRVFKRSDKLYLFGGHHRIAVLAVLSFSIVPDVYIFKNRHGYLFFKFKRKIKTIKNKLILIK